MSLVVEASPSSPITASSTTDHEGAVFSTFALPSSPESPLTAAPSSPAQFTPIKAIDPLFLRSSDHRRSPLPLARVWVRTPKRSFFGDGEPHPADFDGDFTTPVKKAVKRILDLDPSAVLDSNSRDSGFESEASRLSYSLSSSSASVNSNPGTPSSSASSHSVGHGLCLTPTSSHDDPLSGAADGRSTAEAVRSAHLCLWDGCDDPDLASKEVDESRRDLLSHVLSQHVQPLESDREANEAKDQPASFRCLWRGCKVYGKGSKLYSWLEAHVVERHAGPRPFACPLPGCRQRFASKQSAERHINSHFADDRPLSCKMAPSNLVNKPSPISGTAFRRRDTTKSPLSKHPRVASNARISAAKRRLLDEEDVCQQHKRPQQKPLDRLAAKMRRETTSQRRQLNGLRAAKDSMTVERTITEPAMRTRHGGKMRVDNDNPCTESYGLSAEAGIFTKQLSVISSTSSQSRSSSVVFVNKKPTSTFSTEISLDKAASALETTGTTTAAGVGGAAKRKTIRVRNPPEDAIDAMHARAIHVLAARYLLSIKTPTDSDHGRRKSSSCHDCSGNFSYQTDMASSSKNCRRSETTPRHCVCSDYITFHAKVLAKRTSCINGKKPTNDSSSTPQRELFCSWTPRGLLPSTWIDETAFQSIIRLRRSLFPSLVAPESEKTMAEQLT